MFLSSKNAVYGFWPTLVVYPSLQLTLPSTCYIILPLIYDIRVRCGGTQCRDDDDPRKPRLWSETGQRKGLSRMIFSAQSGARAKGSEAGGGMIFRDNERE